MPVNHIKPMIKQVEQNMADVSEERLKKHIDELERTPWWRFLKRYELQVRAWHCAEIYLRYNKRFKP